MPRRNHSNHAKRKSNIQDRFDTDYVSMPEFPQYTSIAVVPLKTIFYNLDAASGANDFCVIRSFNDPIMRKLEKKIGGAA